MHGNRGGWERGAARNCSEDEKTTIRRLHAAGYSGAKIAKVLGRGAATVTRWMRALALPPAHSTRRWTAAEDAQMFAMVAGGESYSEIAAAMDRSTSSITQRMCVVRALYAAGETPSYPPPIQVEDIPAEEEDLPPRRGAIGLPPEDPDLDALWLRATARITAQGARP